jgi:hypothetical protein
MIPKFHYYITPLFILLDYVWGISILAGGIAILGFHGSIRILGIFENRPHSNTSEKSKADAQ